MSKKGVQKSKSGQIEGNGSTTSLVIRLGASHPIEIPLVKINDLQRIFSTPRTPSPWELLVEEENSTALLSGAVPRVSPHAGPQDV